MRKFITIDKKYLKISLYVLAVILLSIAFEKILNTPSLFLSSISGIFSKFIAVISPFLYGFAIAFLLNPLVMSIENHVLSKINMFKNNFKARRTIANIITYILVIGCISWLFTVFIPQIGENIKNFIVSLPGNLQALEKEANIFFDSIEYIDSKDVTTMLNLVFSPILNLTADLPYMAQKIINGTFIAASTTLNIILGIFISFYMLTDKENFIRETKKIFYAFGEEKKTDKLMNNLSRVNAIFKGFLIGKTIDSLIIGILCFLGLTIMKIPFSVMISVIVGVTNMIPYFGPFIGAIPSILIVLLISPIKAVWVAIFILILQQLDGNVIGPKILGISTGMSALWIIFSVTIGGALAGPVGMLLGVPICASIKLFFGETVNQAYAEKYFYEATDRITETEKGE